MSANVSESPEAVTEREPERFAEPPGASAPVPVTSAIRQAIEEILRINKDLEWVLLEMEKALETLEEAEVQKYADEREIESLKNAMRQLGRTREAVQRIQQGGQRRPDDPRRPPRHGDRERRDHRGPRERREQRHQPHHHAEHHPEHAERSDAHASLPSHEGESHREPPPEPEIPV